MHTDLTGEDRARKLAQVKAWLRSLNEELGTIESEIEHGADACGHHVDDMLDDLHATLAPLWAGE